MQADIALGRSNLIDRVDSSHVNLGGKEEFNQPCIDAGKSRPMAYDYF